MTIVPILSVVSLGIILLFSFWSLKITIWLFYSYAKSIEDATHLLVTNAEGDSEIVELEKGKVRIL